MGRKRKTEKPYWQKLISNKIFIFVVLLAILAGASIALGYTKLSSGETSWTPTKVTAFYSGACAMCEEYIDNELIPVLKASGIRSGEITKLDYVNDFSSRMKLNEMNQKYAVPQSLQSHMPIFIASDVLIILEGHVPIDSVREVLKPENQIFERIILYQDEMHNPVSYKAWGYLGDIKEYSIGTPISIYLSWYEQISPGTPSNGNQTQNTQTREFLLPAVLISGLLDGINPCAFAVLPFLMAFLFTLQRPRIEVLEMGTAYVSFIYLAYLLIGLGLLQALVFSGSPHFLARVGAVMVIGLGVVNYLTFLFPDFPLKIKMPKISMSALRNWTAKATLPSASIAGFLIGLCTFPCTGGIYVAIIGLLASQTSYFEAVGYLLLYNIMFILPLVAILLVASNGSVTERLRSWREKNKRAMYLLSGVVMIVLGAAILFFI